MGESGHRNAGQRVGACHLGDIAFENLHQRDIARNFGERRVVEQFSRGPAQHFAEVRPARFERSERLWIIDNEHRLRARVFRLAAVGDRDLDARRSVFGACSIGSGRCRARDRIVVVRARGRLAATLSRAASEEREDEKQRGPRTAR
jgi:hypothetical protein